jgi:hypothetical protein
MALAAGVFGAFKLDLKQTEEFVECLRGRNSFFQSTALAEGDDVFRRILEANAICGAVSAKEFNSRGGHIGLKAGNVKLFSTSGLHSAKSPSSLS